MNKTDETLKLAKECGATTYTNRHYPDATAVTFSPLAWENFCEQALAAPVQEPVAQSMIKALTHAVEIAEAKRPGTWDDLLQYRVLLNTPPAQRQWVGLTDEEIQTTWDSVMDGAVFTRKKVYEAIETKLKEKNT
jgi:hypothetical protein